MYKGDIFYPRYQEGSSAVTGVKFGILRMSDGYWYDFADGTFKVSGWTTQYLAMTESSNGLWIYSTGWTTPTVKAVYTVQFMVTDDNGEMPAEGELIEVQDIVPTIVTTTTASTTTAGMLAKVNAAIDAIMGGGAVQSCNINGQNIQKYSLTELMALRDRLQKEINAATYRGSRNYIEMEDVA